MVTALQQQRDEIGAERELAGTHLVEHAFQVVGEADDAVQPEQPGGALDGVRGAEQGVDALVIVTLGLGLQLHQPPFHALQQFLRLDDEGLQRLPHLLFEVHACSCGLAAWPNSTTGSPK
ncbi:hypothetical protein GALL_402550 [mine drainage metagenome]|uniref:Uncharacterized protein n=1 Tax=mine drainage metagenome TaxID=410659 RepID=A0A1J5Q3Z2_9ZZZZ